MRRAGGAAQALSLLVAVASRQDRPGMTHLTESRLSAPGGHGGDNDRVYEEKLTVYEPGDLFATQDKDGRPTMWHVGDDGKPIEYPEYSFPHLREHS